MSSNGVSISSDDRGPWINVVTWILVVITLLATTVKCFTKWGLVHKIQFDDIFVTAGAVSSLRISETPPVVLEADSWSSSSRLATEWRPQHKLRRD